MPNTNLVRSWRPAPAIRLSFFLHAAAVVGVVVQPTVWGWSLGAVLINHLVLSMAALWPRGRLLGPNVVRLPESAIRRGEVALTFDDGPDPAVTPKVLDLLDQYQAKASFFCIAQKVAAFPDVAKEITRRGHSVENHTYRHSYAFAFYGMSRLRCDLSVAQTLIVNTTGRLPRFFRAPAGFRSPLLDPVISRCGLRYVSWTRRGFDGIRSKAPLVLRRLVRNLAAGDVLVLHDGGGKHSASEEPVVLKVLPGLLDEISTRRLKSVSLPMAFSNESTS